MERMPYLFKASARTVPWLGFFLLWESFKEPFVAKRNDNFRNWPNAEVLDLYKKGIWTN